jgi:predicted CopG family antitoxin
MMMMMMMMMLRELGKQNINISAKETQRFHEMKQHKPCFSEGCSELLEQRKQAKLQ